MVNRSKTLNVRCTSHRLSTTSLSQLRHDDVIHLYEAALRAIEEENYHELCDLLLDQNEHSVHTDKLSGESLGSLLFKACNSISDSDSLGNKSPNLDIPMMLVDLGANVNHIDREQAATCLMVAAKKGNDELIELLIELGAKVNSKDRYGWTALLYASYFGQVSSARCLLNHGAHVNVTDCDGMSCLIWASGRGPAELVDLLLSRGAQVNAVDRYHTSPLIWASRKGNTDIVDILLKSGANVNEQGMYGWTPLIVAVKENHKDIVRLALSYSPRLDICDGERLTALMIACIERYEDIAIELIENGAPVNQVDRLNMSPLILAAKSRCGRLVRALIKAGAVLEHEGQDGRSAVHWAISNDDPESYKLFLDLGVDPSSKNLNGETHLMLAAKYQSERIIKLILEHNTQSIGDATPERAADLVEISRRSSTTNSGDLPVRRIGAFGDTTNVKY